MYFDDCTSSGDSLSDPEVLHDLKEVPEAEKSRQRGSGTESSHLVGDGQSYLCTASIRWTIRLLWHLRADEKTSLRKVRHDRPHGSQCRLGVKCCALPTKADVLLCCNMRGSSSGMFVSCHR